MKEGLIVYVVGSEPLPENFDLAKASRSLGWTADQVELVSHQQGFFSVEDAWHYLLTRGCGRIHLAVAQAADQEHLHPLSPRVRLSG